jgi:REP element-mobilizing transposase RayT
MVISSENKALYFATLKLAVGMHPNGLENEFFNKREYCDEFIKTLIYCIETRGLTLYGFVILSNQVHLIVNAENGNVNKTIEDLKVLSSNEVIMHLKKKIDGNTISGKKDMIEFRRFFSLYLNNHDAQIWQKEIHLTELELKSPDKIPSIIGTDILVAHLADRKRNYLQVGATAFTKLMMETMKI